MSSVVIALPCYVSVSFDWVYMCSVWTYTCTCMYTCSFLQVLIPLIHMYHLIFWLPPVNDFALPLPTCTCTCIYHLWSFSLLPPPSSLLPLSFPDCSSSPQHLPWLLASVPLSHGEPWTRDLSQCWLRPVQSWVQLSQHTWTETRWGQCRDIFAPRLLWKCNHNSLMRQETVRRCSVWKHSIQVPIPCTVMCLTRTPV